MVNDLFIAENIREAVSYMKRGATLLAGGTEINRLDSSVKAKSLVSIGRVKELDFIEKTSVEGFGKCIRIGSMCTFQEIVESKSVPQYLKDSCLFMSSRIRRNMATVGGNIAVKRDDSYLLPTLLAVDAGLQIMTKAGKTSVIDCKDYVADRKYPDCLIVALLLPATEKKIGYKRYSNTAASHGFITMAVCKEKKSFRTGLCIKNSGIFVFDDLPKVSDIPLKDDMFGSKDYKKYLIEVTKEDLVKVLGGVK